MEAVLGEGLTKFLSRHGKMLGNHVHFDGKPSKHPGGLQNWKNQEIRFYNWSLLGRAPILADVSKIFSDITILLPQGKGGPKGTLVQRCPYVTDAHQNMSYSKFTKSSSFSRLEQNGPVFGPLKCSVCSQLVQKPVR